MSDRADRALARLEADGLVQRAGSCYRTTRRWQGAMARAALRLMVEGAPDGDLRVPIAAVLIDLYGRECEDADLIDLVAAILPIEVAGLAPAATAR